MNDNTSDTGTNPELLAFVERRENLAAEKKDIADQEKKVNAEIKDAGFELKWVNHLIRQRALDADERMTQNEERRIYEKGVGLR